MAAQYTFSSLADMASFFSALQGLAQLRSASATTKRDASIEKREAYTWGEAARIISSSTITIDLLADEETP